MANNRVQNGRRITADPAATVAAGDVAVIGNLVGVWLTDGVSGTPIEAAISEVYNLPKLDAAVITHGMRVTLDVTTNEVDDDAITPAAGDVVDFGVAWEAKGATTGETIAVLLTPGTGVVT